MKYTLLLVFLFNMAAVSATTLSPSQPGCDTILTTEGKIYVGTILRHNAIEIQFSLCDATDNTVYSIPTARVAAVKNAPVEIKNAKALPKPKHAPAETKPSTRPKHHAIKANGTWLVLDATQLPKKGIVLNYERQFIKGLSYTIDLGARWHSLSPTGSLVYQYTESWESNFIFPSEHTYTPSKPKDFGSFLPTFSLNLGGGARLYTKDANKSNLFLQPSFSLFYHSGLKIHDELTMISSTSSGGFHNPESWFSIGDSYNSRNWRLERQITERTSRLNLNATISLGYRIVPHEQLAIDFGIAGGWNSNGTYNDIRYYGIQASFVRGFVTIGWKIH